MATEPEVREVESITPQGNTTQAKHLQVRQMFNTIATRYDLMNTLMSLGLHRRWQRLTIQAAAQNQPRRVLDLATGTGALAIALARALPQATITGADISEGMVQVGRRKLKEQGLEHRVKLEVADALALPWSDGTFDALTVAYGVRNFENLMQGYKEMWRVLRPGGRLVVLELTPPSSKLITPFYKAYTGAVIPVAGYLISGSYKAYKYLPRSIAAVPARAQMTALMQQAGFTGASFRSLNMGVCTLYTALKP